MKTLSKSIAIAGLLALSFSINSCMNYLKGSGNVVVETREAGVFDKLEVSGAFDVYIKKGEVNDLQIKADDNLQQAIIVVNDDGELRIYSDKNIRNSTELKVFITVTTLSEIELSGAVDLIGKDNMELDRLKVETSGASDVDLNITVNKLELDCSGSADIKLEGSCDDASMSFSGASDLDANNFEIDDLDIEINGAGSAKVNVRNNLKAEVNGAGSVLYKGTPDVDSKISGAGSIRKQ